MLLEISAPQAPLRGREGFRWHSNISGFIPPGGFCHRLIRSKLASLWPVRDTDTLVDTHCLWSTGMAGSKAHLDREGPGPLSSGNCGLASNTVLGPVHELPSVTLPLPS